MKRKLILRALILLSGTALLFAGCKKTENSAAKSGTTTPASANKQAAARQLALNLYQSLTGNNGGISVYNGLSTPAIATVKGSAPKVNSDGFVCGFYVNDGINYTTNVGDSLKSTSHGSIAFYYVCSNNEATGYKAQDTLTTIGTGPGYAFADGLSQNYTVTGLNSNNSNVTVDGTIRSTIALSYNNGQKSLTTNTFILNGLYVHNDQSPSDITSGTAIFVSTSISGTVTYALGGTLTFLGNHKAKIDYYDSTFYVDLTTGTVTTSL